MQEHINEIVIFKIQYKGFTVLVADIKFYLTFGGKLRSRSRYFMEAKLTANVQFNRYLQAPVAQSR